MDSPGSVDTARSALTRARTLLRVLDREHSAGELYVNLRGVRHELETAWQAVCAALTASVTPGPLPESPAAQEGSWAAQRALATRTGTQRARVLGLLVESAEGCTDPDLAWMLGLSVTTARQLRWELMEAGWVCTSGRRRVNPTSGRMCSVFFATEAGHTQLNRLMAGQLGLDLAIPLDTHGD